MWEFAKQTILKLEDRLKKEIQFVAAEHNDHTPNRHVHVIALIPGRLNVADLEALRMAATKEALFQRQERDLALASQQAREAVPVRPFARTVYPADRAYREGLELDDRCQLYRAGAARSAFSKQTMEQCDHLSLMREKGREGIYKML